MSETGKPAIRIHERDNVAVVLEAVAAQETICCQGMELPLIRAKQNIPQYHKVALRAIDTGAAIYKYGEMIGQATRPIQAGEHVHTHNVGDK